MLQRRDLRSADEIICDYVAEIDDHNENEVWTTLAWRLGWTVYAAKQRFEQIRKDMGWQAE